ncbi:D-alanyl-D-alanine carboxypeptidase family protein [Candidatus Falkowbacteria bacterium]|nr:D-alanyl-D-alanine carboxypeptidase family protein [Candidatus Falkowbacteria bacterium]
MMVVKKIIRILFLLLALTLLPQVVFASGDEVEGYTKLLIPIPVCNQELLTSGGIFCDGRGWTTHMKDIPALINTYFTFVVTAGIVIFAFTAILSGFQMLMSSLNFIQVKKVTTRLKQSASGLIALMFIWVVLYQINPALTDIKISKIEEVQNIGCCQLKDQKQYYWMKDVADGDEIKYQCDAGDVIVEESKCSAIVEPYTESEEDIPMTPTPLPTMSVIVGPNIENPGNHTASLDNINSIVKAAATTYQESITLHVTSGYRTWEEQQRKKAENCPPGATKSSQCNPPTAINYSSHNSGTAVDLWGFQNNKQCIMQKQCNTNDPASDPCRKNKCQAAVIRAMQAQGFCNLSSEAWHFEKPHKSPGCKIMPDYSQ